MSEKKVFRVGSRKSQLALIQTNQIIDKLKEVYPDLKFEVVSMTTTGDRILDSALSKIGEKSLFTKELEEALLDEKVDFLVHSLKDLPTAIPDGLVIGSVYKRDSPYDAVVMHSKNKGKTLGTLPKGSVVGTSSLRRCAQIQRKHPHLKIHDIRGNLNTRFRKLDEDNIYDAIVLAEAGLERMGWTKRIAQILSPEECMYAVSQGAMAVECRSQDKVMLEMLQNLHDKETAICCIAERAFLKRLEGGCSVPVSTHTEIKDGMLSIKGGVFSVDGKEAVVDALEVKLPESAEDKETDEKVSEIGVTKYASIVGVKDQPTEPFSLAEKLGEDLADKMSKQGALKILNVAKRKAATAIMEEKAKKMKKDTNSSAEVVKSACSS